MNYAMVGVLAVLVSALTEAGISVFAVGTFDTDNWWRMGDVDRLVAVLAASNAPGTLKKTLEGSDGGTWWARYFD